METNPIYNISRRKKAGNNDERGSKTPLSYSVTITDFLSTQKSSTRFFDRALSLALCAGKFLHAILCFEFAYLHDLLEGFGIQGVNVFEAHKVVVVGGSILELFACPIIGTMVTPVARFTGYVKC